ncbi:MAG: gamma-glutamyl-gamma-aminobutyrate hydrolase family protein [Gemmatimonadales bacterium]
MTPPRVGVSGVMRRWQEADRAAVNAAYLRSVAQAGGVPLVLSQLIGAGHAARALAACDALLLSGGEDVDPTLYGAPPSRSLGAVDRARDGFEIALFRAACDRGLPVLGICRGLQVINVAMGGTLWQDLPSERPGPVNHDPGGPRNARTHPVRLAPESRVAEALGTNALTPNSFHHQGIRDLAPGLVASGWAADGLIEAVETDGREGWLLAVQWHPEEMHADTGAPERGLFAALVAASASERRPARSPR